LFETQQAVEEAEVAAGRLTQASQLVVRNDRKL
jgi:hypothetical protein